MCQFELASHGLVSHCNYDIFWFCSLYIYLVVLFVRYKPLTNFSFVHDTAFEFRCSFLLLKHLTVWYVMVLQLGNTCITKFTYKQSYAFISLWLA